MGSVVGEKSGLAAGEDEPMQLQNRRWHSGPRDERRERPL
jgi:hypothetical protein